MTIAPLRRKQALIVLGVATIAFTVVLEVVDPSHVSHGPTILDFEFAVTRHIQVLLGKPPACR